MTNGGIDPELQAKWEELADGYPEVVFAVVDEALQVAHGVKHQRKRNAVRDAALAAIRKRVTADSPVVDELLEVEQ